jgi:outer membrane receptor protein involved in Fe transport
LITFVTAGTEEDFAFDNADTVSARGIEFEAEARSGTGMQVIGSATFQRSVDAGGERLINWPSRVAEIRCSVPGPWAGSSFAAEVQQVGARRTLAGGWVSAYTVAHAAFSAKLSSRLSLTAAARNLFNARFSDPASGEHVQNEIQQNGRVLRLDLRWTLFSR